MKKIYFPILIAVFSMGCSSNTQIKTVSVADFSKFISDTDYITDAERYGWSIVQEDVFNFRTEEGANWRVPNAVDSSQYNFPVTQVSYNDALAYCKWAGVRLPNYEEYWELTKSDARTINENTTSILPNDQINVVGNVWDITTTEDVFGEVRLAGGSYFCNPSSCNGTSPERRLFVDKETGNIHIGFSVVY